jgi:drug/metabolite transporter (DMT)-like permease
MTAFPQPRRATEFALLAVLAGLWGSSYLLIKLALATLPPLTLIALRVSIAAILLLMLMRLRGEHLPRDPGNLRALFMQSLLNSSLAWLVLAWGQQYVPSGTAGVLNSTSPLFVFLIALASLLFSPAARRKTRDSTPLRALGVALGLVGVVLVIGVDALNGLGQQTLAQAAILGGAFLYACAAISGQRLVHLSPLVTACGTLCWATLTLLPLAIVIDRPWTLSPSPTSLGAAVALGVFCTAFALILYFRLIRTLGPMGVASQSYLRAGVSVLLGFLVLGEQPPPSVLAGLLLTIIGVALINWPVRRRA